jgi:N-acetyl-gamma-glutamylphosphate reductase
VKNHSPPQKNNEETMQAVKSHSRHYKERKAKKRKTTQEAVKTTPHLNPGKGGFLVSGTVRLPNQKCVTFIHDIYLFISTHI